MSKYTTEVRYICEEAAGLVESVGFNKTEDVITTALPKVFDFDFPIFDEEYRPVLERKILRHFYTREICEETVGLWKLRLDDKLNIIMPYYNQLYKSELIKFNPLYDIEYSSIRHGQKDEKVEDNNSHNSMNVNESVKENENSNLKVGNTEGENKANGNVKGTESKISHDNEKGNGAENNNSWDLYSDTPQGGISRINAATDPSVSGLAYLTNARNVTNDGSNNYSRENNSGAVNSSDTTETNENTYKTDSKEATQNNGKSKENNKDVNHSTDNRNKNAQNLESYLENVHGKRGGKSFSALLNEYRSTFLNIDAMILEELEPLFMQLW